MVEFICFILLKCHTILSYLWLVNPPDGVAGVKCDVVWPCTMAA